MKLLGRGPELKRLRDLFNQDRASFVVLTGRRRIGKSSLIEYFAKQDYQFIKVQGLAPGKNVTPTSQLEAFSEQLGQTTKSPLLKFNNWTEVFNTLDKMIKKKKTVILLDEISWMAKDSPDFAGKLKIAWDDLFKNRPNLMLVVCGSVSSWIEENILRKTDFVGRISMHLHLQELPLSSVGGFWGKYETTVSDFEKIKFLIVSGGVPRYLEELNPSLPAGLNIAKLCFTTGGFFVEEFDKIFNETFERRAIIYRTILEQLTEKKLTYSEICKKLRLPKGGNMSNYLDDLELSGFIACDAIYSPVGKQSKSSLYRISDNYIRFYLKYIRPNLDKIKKNIFSKVSIENQSNWSIIQGLQFENLVLANLPLIIESLSLSSEEITSFSPYFQKKTARTKGACQIDLMITSRFGTVYVCEIKMRKVIGPEVIKEVQQKIKVLARPKNISVRPVLIYAGHLEEEVVQSQFFSQIISVADWMRPL